MKKIFFLMGKKVFAMHRTLLWSVLSVSFLIPFVLLAAQKSEKKEHTVNELKKFVPANGDVVVVFTFDGIKEDARALNSFSESIRQSLLMYTTPAQSTLPDKLRKKGLAPDAAIYVGNEKTGYVLFPIPIPQKDFLALFRKNAGNLSEVKVASHTFYAGNFSSVAGPSAKGGFIFTFLSPEIAAITENRRHPRNMLFAAPTVKKGISPEMERLLSVRRKEAFIYGGLRLSAIAKRLMRLFPTSAQLQNASFDVVFTKRNTLNMQMIISADTKETAGALAMTLNGYKMLLAGLLQSAEANAARQAGKQVKLTPPDQLISVTQENNFVKLSMDIHPELMQTLGAFAVMTGMAGR